MGKAKLTYTPAKVRVADDRVFVRGAKYVITDYYDDPVSGYVIPPEEPSPDCWLGRDGICLDEDLWDLLAFAAESGAAGQSGEIDIEDGIALSDHPEEYERRLRALAKIY